MERVCVSQTLEQAMAAVYNCFTVVAQALSCVAVLRLCCFHLIHLSAAHW